MSSENLESISQSSDVYETYKFESVGNVFLYTSDFIDREVELGLYEARSLERSGFNYSLDNSEKSCTITIPSTDALALLIKPSVVIKPMKVTINRYFSVNPGDYENVFTGYLQESSFSGGICTMEFQSVLLEIGREVCRVKMQALCNNDLYDSVCTVNPDDYEISAAVTISGKTLVSAAFAAFVDGYFYGGKVLYNGIYQFITGHVGNTIYIQRQFDEITDGDSVRVWPGCTKHPGEACDAKFNNLENFVGMPYIPLKDAQKVAITAL